MTTLKSTRYGIKVRCFLFLIMNVLIDCQVRWVETIHSTLLEKHKMFYPHDVLSNMVSSPDFSGVVIACKTFNKYDGDKFIAWSSRHRKDFHPIHIKKSSSAVCFVTEMSASDAAKKYQSDPTVEISVIPHVLKIDVTTLQYFEDKVLLEQKPPQQVTEGTLSIEDMKERLILTFEFTPHAIKRMSIRQLVFNLFQQIVETEGNLYTNYLLSTMSPAWTAILNRHVHLTSESSCDLRDMTNIQYGRHSVELIDISNITDKCLVTMTHIAAQSSDVLRISLQPRATSLNYDAKSHIQAGHPLSVPFTDSGLTGEGQVCGVADSGVNDLSSFFVDNSNGYSSAVTNRDGVVEMDRRKIVQYTSYADSYDTEGGHGTHVCGSIAGASLEEFTKMDGVAPKAKLSFFDVGLTDRPFLMIPPLELLFTTQYNASARVHSNSWGSSVGIYSQNSYDVDHFSYTHDESLLIFAAGNSGAVGLKSIISPANAKNCLTVGAGQLHDTYDDSLFSESNYTVAYFSSLGPTFDGRIKPDIIAPGDNIMSSYAGDLNELKNAIKGGGMTGNPPTTCAVHQLDGTSMATPLVSGTALLIRQYFMDSNFWALLCNPQYTSCRQGSFTPSGFLLKTLILHSGRAVPIYSNPLYDLQNSFSSFALSNPPDVFQGYGEILLANILPLHNNKGLDPSLDLIVMDRMQIASFSTIQFDIDLSTRTKHRNKDSTSNTENSSELPPLKITLCWYDPPSFFGSGSSLLIHDLDLIVEGPRGEIYIGNKYGIRQSKANGNVNLDEIVTDDVNPNEQVTIPNPQCATPVVGQEGGSCMYKVYIQSYALTVSQMQSFALVITTSGVVGEAQHTNQLIPILPSKQFDSVSIHNSSMNNGNLKITSHISATLRNNEFVKSNFIVDQCAQLDSIDVLLHYHVMSSDLKTDDDLVPTYSEASKMYLIVIDPAGRIVIIGSTFDDEHEESGEDETSEDEYSLLHWPNEWKNHHSGEYKAHVIVRKRSGTEGGGGVATGLFGIGSWTLRVWNGGSSNRLVSIYNVTITMNFAKTMHDPSLCDIVPSSIINTKHEQTLPTPTRSTPKAAPVKIKPKTFTHTIRFESVPLGVVMSGNWFALKQDRTQISAFKLQDAQLQSIKLSLDAIEGIVQTKGMDAWLLTTIVTAPNGLIAQVGGFEWLGQKDKFYNRRWPDLWLGQMSNGHDWESTRDVSPAGLCSVSTTTSPTAEVTSNVWTVELAMGYALTVKPRTLFTGNLTLTFMSPIPGMSNLNESRIPRDSYTVYTPPLDQTSSVDSKGNTVFARIFILCVILVTLLVMAMQILKHRNKDKSLLLLAKNFMTTPVLFKGPKRNEIFGGDTKTYDAFKYSHISSQDDTDSTNNQHQHFSFTSIKYQQPNALQRHLDRDETKCLIHTCGVKGYNSESDLVSRNQLTSSSPYHIQPYHSCGKEQHRQQMQLMPRLVRGRSQGSDVLDVEGNRAVENTPLFVMLKSTKISHAAADPVASQRQFTIWSSSCSPRADEPQRETYGSMNV